MAHNNYLTIIYRGGLSRFLTWSDLVPRMVLRVVEASSLVDWLAFATLHTENIGLAI